MSSKPISHAYVYFTNGLQRIVPVSSISNFKPANQKDYVKNKKYKVWLKKNNAKNNLLLNSFILLLGTSVSDVEKQRDATRLKFPNKRNMSFSSTEAGPSDSKVTDKKSNSTRKLITKAKKKLDFDQKAATYQQNQKILDKYSKLVQNRKALEDSESDIESNVDDDVTIQDPESVIMERFVTDHTVSADETEYDSPPRNDDKNNSVKRNVASSAVSKSQQSKPQPLERVTRRESSRSGSSSPCRELTSSRPRQESVLSPPRRPAIHREPALLRPAGPSSSPCTEPTSSRPRQQSVLSPPRRLAIHREPALLRPARPPSPPQHFAQKEPAGPQPNVRREEHAGVQFVPKRIDQPQDVIYLDANTPVDMDIWEVMKLKSDSKFVREVAQKLWGTEALQRKCLDPKRANKGKENAAEEEIRKQLTPTKYDTVKDCLYTKITESGVTGKQRAMRMKKVWRYMSSKIYDVRRKLAKP